MGDVLMFFPQSKSLWSHSQILKNKVYMHHKHLKKNQKQNKKPKL